MAHDGNLTRTAERVNLSQSALSSQIRTFWRSGWDTSCSSAPGGKVAADRRVGRIVLDHADRIFGTGEELVATLKRTGASQPPLRLGRAVDAVTEFPAQFSCGRLIGTQDVDIILKSGSAGVLFEALKSLALERDADNRTTVQPARRRFHRPSDRRAIRGHPWHTGTDCGNESLRDLLAREAADRAHREPRSGHGFESLIARLGVTPRIAADVDNMAMVRLLAREDMGLAIAPAVVLADEDQLRPCSRPRPLRSRDRREAFYAVTVRRSFPHPLLASLVTP